jgi:hypothetical protein
LKIIHLAAEILSTARIIFVHSISKRSTISSFGINAFRFNSFSAISLTSIWIPVPTTIFVYVFLINVKSFSTKIAWFQLSRGINCSSNSPPTILQPFMTKIEKPFLQFYNKRVIHGFLLLFIFEFFNSVKYPRNKMFW